MAGAVQLDLFKTTPETVEKFDVEWSYSRRKTLEQCPRRYYYRYYGASARKAKAEPQKETLRVLKGLSNRYLRTGKLLHLAIGTYFKKRQEGETGSFEWLYDWIQGIYHRDREYSRSREYQQASSNEEYPPVPLLEYHYGFPNVEELLAQSERRLLGSLEVFLSSDRFVSLRLNGERPSTLVEQQVRFETEHFKARGKIDLAFQGDDGRIVVCDWKMGSADTIHDSLQLLFYALWAAEEHQYSPSEMVISKAYLGDEAISTSTVSDRDLQRAKARIIQDLEKMKSLDDYGSNAVAEAFTPCGQARICELCPFQGVCPKELD
jgi:RecB family exonuclease